jgi:hypothetical protein
MLVLPEGLPADVGRLWLGFAAVFLVKVLSEMPNRIFRFEDYEDQTPGSPVMEMALDLSS